MDPHTPQSPGPPSNVQRTEGHRLAAGITIAAVSVAALHLAFPDVQVDTFTIALVVIAAVPWFAHILRTVTLPGGVTLEFQQLAQRIETVSERVDELRQFVIQGVGGRQRDELIAHLAKLRTYVGEFAGTVGEAPAVYVEGSSDASYYDRENHEIVTQRNFAHDVDVVGREYMHSVLFTRAVPEALEAGGLEAGLASYLVASEQGKPTLYESLAPIRLVNDRQFTEEIDPDDPYNNLGEIWCGAFWKVRALLGQKDADGALWTAWMNTDLGTDENVRTAFLAQLVGVVKARHGDEKAQSVEGIFTSHGLALSQERPHRARPRRRHDRGGEPDRE